MSTNSKFQKTNSHTQMGNSKNQDSNSKDQNSNFENQSLRDSRLHSNDTPGGQDPDFGNGEGSGNQQSPMANDQMGDSKFQDSNSNDAEIERLQQELENEREAKLSALADYQNLQRRTEERIQHMEFLANISVVNEIIDIIDDFDRAFSHAKEGVDLAGFQAIKNKLIQILVRMNVEEVIVNKGDEFNAHLHEAVTTLPSNDKKNVHKIAELVQKGYLIRKGENVEVIRPARVVVFS